MEHDFVALLFEESQNYHWEWEEKEAHEEDDDVNQNKVAAPFLDTWLSTILSGFTPESTHGEDVGNKSVKRVDSSNIPDPHEVDTEGNGSQQNSGTDPFDDMVHSKQEDSSVKHSWGLQLGVGVSYFASLRRWLSNWVVNSG